MTPTGTESNPQFTMFDSDVLTTGHRYGLNRKTAISYENLFQHDNNFCAFHMLVVRLHLGICREYL